MSNTIYVLFEAQTAVGYVWDEELATKWVAALNDRDVFNDRSYKPVDESGINFLMK